jgi:hypothetical protein
MEVVLCAMGVVLCARLAAGSRVVEPEKRIHARVSVRLVAWPVARRSVECFNMAMSAPVEK